jgi:hypothetical protein
MGILGTGGMRFLEIGVRKMRTLKIVGSIVLSGAAPVSIGH